MNKREWMLQAAIVALGQNQIDWMAPHVAAGGIGAVYDAICDASPETPQEGAWVEHDGDVSKAPSPEQRVEVTFRDGEQNGGYGEDFSWDHIDSTTDIVRWRYA